VPAAIAARRTRPGADASPRSERDFGAEAPV